MEDIHDKLNDIEHIIRDKKIFPSQIANRILALDKNCGDIIFLQHILYPFLSSGFNSSYIVENKEILSHINNILYNEKLNFYQETRAETKHRVVSFFLDLLGEEFKRAFCWGDIDINQNASDNRIVFYKLNNLFLRMEINIKAFEEETGISFFRDYKIDLNKFKEYILSIFSESSYGGYDEWERWNIEEQEEFEKALNIRLTTFCSNIGFPEKINIKINYGGTRELIPKGCLGFIIEVFLERPIMSTLFFPVLLYDASKIVYKSIKSNWENRNVNKVLMNNVISGNENLLLPEKKDVALLVSPIKNKVNHPVLAKDLENIETAKKELSTFFSSQEKFDIFIQTNCTMYLEPYLDYIEKHPDLSEDEVKDFHIHFFKLKLIIENKIDEFKTKSTEISKTELNVLKNEVDRVLKEKNIFFSQDNH